MFSSSLRSFGRHIYVCACARMTKPGNHPLLLRPPSANFPFSTNRTCCNSLLRAVVVIMTLRMNIAPIPELQFADKAAALPFLTSIAEGFASSCADGTFDDLLTTNVTALALQNVTTAVSVMERDFLVTPVWLATFCAYAQCPIWGPIAWIAGTVMALVIAIVLTPTLVCGAKQHDSMAFFTRGYIQSMDERFPGNNFLVWHNSQNGQLCVKDLMIGLVEETIMLTDTRGIEHFERNTHAHYELDVPCAGTEGYELHSFYRGNFTRSVCD